MSHIICTYNFLAWKWFEEKVDIKWMYLLCFKFVDTAFLLCVGQDLLLLEEVVFSREAISMKMRK